MKISPEKLAAEAEATGFRPDVLEKVAHLLGLLNALRSHPFLKEKLVLKGGTALNLFIFDVPRLSVDIDLNYVGAEDRDGMLAERPKVEQAVQAVFAREGFTVRRMPEEHAGGKWSLRYGNGPSRGGNLEVDLNWLCQLDGAAEGLVVGKSQLADCNAAIRDSRGGWLLNSAIMPPPAIPLAAISFGN
jgi:hypothetical protein